MPRRRQARSRRRQASAAGRVEPNSRTPGRAAGVPVDSVTFRRAPDWPASARDPRPVLNRREIVGHLCPGVFPRALARRARRALVSRSIGRRGRASQASPLTRKCLSLRARRARPPRLALVKRALGAGKCPRLGPPETKTANTARSPRPWPAQPTRLSIPSAFSGVFPPDRAIALRASPTSTRSSHPPRRRRQSIDRRFQRGVLKVHAMEPDSLM